MSENISTYYAVCNVNGPISKRIKADSISEAIRIFDEADKQDWIDDSVADAEDSLGIFATDTTTEDEFAVMLQAAGYEVAKDLEPVVNGHTMRSAHLADGWTLWVKK